MPFDLSRDGKLVNMSIGALQLIILMVIPLLGGGLIVYIIRKRREWRRPILWMLAGILCFELIRQLVWLAYR